MVKINVIKQNRSFYCLIVFTAPKTTPYTTKPMSIVRNTKNRARPLKRFQACKFPSSNDLFAWKDFSGKKTHEHSHIIVPSSKHHLLRNVKKCMIIWMITLQITFFSVWLTYQINEHITLCLFLRMNYLPRRNNCHNSCWRETYECRYQSAPKPVPMSRMQFF